MDSPTVEGALSSSVSDDSLTTNINKIVNLLDSPIIGATPPVGHTDDIDHQTTDSVHQKLLKGVVAYVDVRSHNENRGRCIVRELEHLGAEIVPKFTNDVTHVIYKDGKKSTRDKALKKSVHFVSVLWVDSCKRNQTHVSEQLYRPVLPEDDGTPVIPRFKKQKSMQPKDFAEEVANSAERVKNRRRRQANTALWKMGTPCSPHFPRIVYTGETQPQSPSAMDILRSPGITIPDTPLSMRRKIQELRRKRAAAGLEDSPFLAEPKTALTPLQRRLFEIDESVISEPGSPQTPDVDTVTSGGCPSISKSPTAVCSSPLRSTMSPLAVNSVKTSTTTLSDCSTASESSLCKQTLTKSLKSYRKLLPLMEDLGPKPELIQPFKASNTMQNKEKIFEPNKTQTKKSSCRSKPDNNIKAEAAEGSNSANGEDTKSKELVTRKKRKVSSGSDSGVGKRTKPNKKVRIADFDTIVQGSDEKTVVGKVKRAQRRQSVASSTPTQSPQLTWRQETGKSIKRGRRSVACVPTNHMEPDSIVQSCDPQAPITREPSGSDQQICDTNSCETESNSSLKSAKLTKNPINRRRSIRIKKSTEADGVSLELETKAEAGQSATKSKLDCNSKMCNQKDGLEGEVSAMLQTASVNRCPADFDSTADESIVLQQATRRRQGGTFAAGRRKKRGNSSESETSCTENQLKSKLHKSSLAKLSQSRKSTDEFRPLKSLSKWTLSQKSSRMDSVCNDSSSSLSESSLLSPLTKKLKKTTTAKPVNKGSTSLEESKTSKLGRKSSSVSSRPRTSIVMTSLHFDQQDIVRSVVKKIGSFHITPNVCDTTTHVVCGGPRRTLNILYAIIRGCWIVSLEWVLKSLEMDDWIEEGPYEMNDYFPAAKTNRLQRQSLEGDSYTSDLFSKLGLIHVADHTSPPHHHMVALIKLANGQVTQCMRKADVCINSNSKSDQYITEQWVLDSVTGNQCLSLAQYRCDKVRQQREVSPDF